MLLSIPPHNISKIFAGLMDLHNSYARTFRKIVTAERHNALVVSGLLKDYTYDTEVIREPLIEHVGHLPAIATYLHQHIAHRDEIDLGRALTMLAVHDIGETRVGDMLAYAKHTAHEQAERKAARELLPDYLYAYFAEFEEAQTLDAKFARAVDSLAPALHELAMPQVTLERFAYFNFSVDDIVARKTEHFAWDEVLAELFDHIVGKYREIEKR